MLKHTLTLALAAALVAVTAAVSVAQEAQLIAVLKSDADLEKKSAACRELSHVATKEAVPVLASLLGDEKLSHMARYAMETIADPTADAALRDAMGKLKGRLLTGVIGSLGVRRDAKAVEAMAKLLADSDPEIAQAAARALGKIGTPEAAKALGDALAGVSAANRVDFCEGLFRCAEALAAEGHGDQAKAIYDRLLALSSPQKVRSGDLQGTITLDVPQQIRAGALRGAILLRQKEGIPLMLEAIRGSDYVLTAAAARAAIEMPGAEVTAALAGELPKLPADKQVLLINTLGYRGDASAGPALLALASEGSGAVRLAAVNNLTHLGYVPALPLLAKFSLVDDAELAEAARACLGNFPGKDAQAAILAMLAHNDAKVRSLAVEMIGQRNAAGACESLLKTAGDDEDESVRVAAIKALRDLVGLPELPALLKVLVKARSSAELQAAESALAALCARQSTPASGNVVIVKAEYGKLPEGPAADVTKKVADLVKGGALAVEATNGNFGDPAHGVVKRLRVDYTVNGVAASKTAGENETVAFTAISTPPAVVDAICAAMEGSKGEAKLALLRALRSAGGPKALQTVQAAMTDPDAQVKQTALRALCDWPTPDALPLVAGLIKKAPSETIKILALRGFVRLVPMEDAPAAKKLDSLKEAMGLASRTEEKRLVLSALGNVATPDALTLIASHLDNAALKEEACLAAVSVAEKIVGAHGAEAAAVMKQVAKTTANKKLAARANAVARQAKK